MDLNIKLLSSFFIGVSQLLRFNVIENWRSATPFWGEFRGEGAIKVLKNVLKYKNILEAYSLFPI